MIGVPSMATAAQFTSRNGLKLFASNELVTTGHLARLRRNQKNRNISRKDAKACPERLSKGPQRKRNNIFYPNLASFAP
jgi:hypothetical protein